MFEGNYLKRNLMRLKSRIYVSFPFRNYFINFFKHGKFSGLHMPKVVYLEVTNRCNARCYMCPNLKMERGRGHMPWEIFTKIIDECRDFEGKGLTFVLHKDGEPLMDPMLFKRIEYIKQNLKKSTVQFNSNAMLLNEDKTLKILNSPLDEITFSVDAATAEVYEKIRIGLKYDVVRDNVLKFFEKKKELNKKIKVTLQMVTTDINRHETELYRKQWGDKADRVFIKDMHNFMVQKTSVHGDFSSNKQLTRCLMPFVAMLFYWNGDVALCCWDYDNVLDIGNIEKQSLLEIYNNNKYATIRKAMERKDCKGVKPCDECSQIYGMDGPMWQ